MKKRNDTEKLLLILPAFNEGKALPPLLAACERTREIIPHLIVVVIDDGSSDDTAHVVRSFRRPWCRLVQHRKNMGLAAGMRTGIAYAVKTSGKNDLIAVMDADNSHQPEQLPQMCGKLRSEVYDVIIASRYQPGSRSAGIPPHRQLFSNVMSVAFQMIARVPGVRDYSCGFRVYTAAVLKKALDKYGTIDAFITEKGFACMTEILLKLAHLPGVRIGEWPMDLRYDRKPSVSKMNVWSTIRDQIALVMRHR
ncbi:MAG: glycosyltransferase family 2 protein [Spirochaetota bacterium]